jgi:hypothetical protein
MGSTSMQVGAPSEAEGYTRKAEQRRALRWKWEWSLWHPWANAAPDPPEVRSEEFDAKQGGPPHPSLPRTRPAAAASGNIKATLGGPVR